MTMIRDFVHAARALRWKPNVALIAALALALGIGVSIGVFAIVDSALLRPLPYPGADRIVAVRDQTPDHARSPVTFGTYREIAERSEAFEYVAAARPWQPTAIGAVEAERLLGQLVTADYFRVLASAPWLGRSFDALEDRVGGAREAIISERLWRRRFGSDPTIVGRFISLDGNLYTIVGVMPSSFRDALSPGSEVWALLQYDSSLPPQGREWGRHLRMLGRLHVDANLVQAEGDLERIAANPIAEFSRPPHVSLQHGFSIQSLQGELTRDIVPALLIIVGGSVLLLVIACVNVTTLLLARARMRRAEYATRIALGAPGARLIRQSLAESLLLSAMGGLLGIMLAEAGTRVFATLYGSLLPVEIGGVDFRAVAFTIGVVLLVGFAAGLVPALQACRVEPRIGLEHASARIVGSHGMRNALVVSQVALVVVLLVSTGLVLRSVQTLFAVDPGFEPRGLLVMQVQAGFSEASAYERFFQQSLEAVEGVPGVTSVASTSQLPLSGDNEAYGLRIQDDRLAEAGGAEVFRYAVSPSYFSVMGIPLRRGRFLQGSDGADGAPVALINESLAARLFPAHDPIGQRVVVGTAAFRIVGVVGDVKQLSLGAPEADAVYISSAQSSIADRVRWLLVRGEGNVDTLAPAIREAVWTVDKDQPITRTSMMHELVEATELQRRLVLKLLQIFGASSLLLAAIGLYAVLSGSVNDRMREFALRIALGASPASLVRLVARGGILLTGLGVTIGLGLATAASAAVGSLLFEVSRLDLATYTGVAVLLVVIACLASCAPAWRASRCEPMEVLRRE